MREISQFSKEARKRRSPWHVWRLTEKGANSRGTWTTTIFPFQIFPLTPTIVAKYQPLVRRMSLRLYHFEGNTVVFPQMVR